MGKKKAKDNIKEATPKKEKRTIATIKLVNVGDLYEEVSYKGEDYMLQSQDSMTLTVDISDVDNIMDYFKQANPSINIERLN
jgi:hypothetical protein